jgi:hypothetical protein
MIILIMCFYTCRIYGHLGYSKVMHDHRDHEFLTLSTILGILKISGFSMISLQ